MIRTLFITIAALVALAAPLVPAVAYAYNPIGGICDVPGAQNSSLCQGQGDTSQDPLTGQKGLIRGIANILAFVTGLGAIITIIVGGFRYITANGNADQAKSARGAIIAAIIGIVIILLADTIIGFVLSRI